MGVFRRSVWYFFASVALWLVALAGALDDIDFFNRADFFDRTELHHEHIVVFVAAIALILLIASAVSYLQELRVLPAEAPLENGRERV